MQSDHTLETHEGRNGMTSKEHETAGRDERPSLLETALAYAQRSWPLHPVFGIQNGQCMCGKEDCSLGRCLIRAYQRASPGGRDYLVAVKRQDSKLPEGSAHTPIQT